MIQGTFDVAIDTPKRHKRGTLALKSHEGRIAARLAIPDVCDEEFAGTCADKEFDFAGERELPGIGQTSYEAHGSVWGNSIKLTAQTDVGKVEIFGTRLSASAGEFKSSHEYIMAASTATFADNENAMYSGRYADGG